MPESATHMRMVAALKQWIEDNCEDSEKLFIWTDSPQNTLPKQLIRIEGFVPDVYANSSRHKKAIIGEAKTARDLDTRHTEAQLLSFLKYCSFNKGASLILAVPWDLVRYARSLIKDLKRRCQAEKVKTIVLEDF